ncbi:kinase binding protein CGI-121-domain-containing protein [Mucidula mucida]|nr:kinase binding protein CGI-121-domain-containing protein [Mucidula mucida]
MHSFLFDHLDRCQVAHCALYTPVHNAAAIRQRIISAAKADDGDGERERDEINFAFIDATLITSLLHLQTAIYQAILAELQSSLRTRTVHSEILWALNPTNNITEAIRRYGISDDTKALLVVHICDKSTPSAQVQSKLDKVIDGTLVPLESLQNLTDWSRIQKYYKLNAEPALFCGHEKRHGLEIDSSSYLRIY